MSVPPRPGPYGPLPPNGGQGPAWGAQPQQPGQAPYGAPHQGMPGVHAHWGPQQPWTGGPPPNKPDKTKWLLGGIAVAAIIALTIVGTMHFTRPDPGAGNTPAPGQNAHPEFASTNDTGPANIITDDPTCEAWTSIARDMEAAVPEWNAQDYAVPAKDWTPQQRAAFDKKSAALAGAIPNVTNIAKQTPHRVMRELYGQYIAYAQALIDAIPTYSSTGNYLVGASNQLDGSLTRICDAIHFRAAQQTAPQIPPPPGPSDPEAVNGENTFTSQRFLAGHDSSCSEWMSLAERFDKDSKAWRDIDGKIRATEWSPDQKAVMDAVAPVMSTYADDMERVARQSGNSVWEDSAVLSAQYLRAYVHEIPTYTPNIGYLTSASTYTSNFLYWTCKAVS